jgi:hypothetical protein
MKTMTLVPLAEAQARLATISPELTGIMPKPRPPPKDTNKPSLLSGLKKDEPARPSKVCFFFFLYICYFVILFILLFIYFFILFFFSLQ